MNEVRGPWVLKEGTGNVKENTKRPGKDDPDWRGEMKIDGKEYEVGGWNKVQTNGVNRINFSIKPKRDMPQQGRPVPPSDEPPF